MKELTEKFEKQLTCFAENTEKCKTFSGPIQKEVTRIDKNGEEFTKTISSRLQFTDSASFMASSLSNLLIILLKEHIKLNVNTNRMIKNVELAELNTKFATAFLNTQILKMI